MVTVRFTLRFGVPPPPPAAGGTASPPAAPPDRLERGSPGKHRPVERPPSVLSERQVGAYKRALAARPALLPGGYLSESHELFADDEAFRHPDASLVPRVREALRTQRMTDFLGVNDHLALLPPEAVAERRAIAELLEQASQPVRTTQDMDRLLKQLARGDNWRVFEFFAMTPSLHLLNLSQRLFAELLARAKATGQPPMAIAGVNGLHEAAQVRRADLERRLLGLPPRKHFLAGGSLTEIIAYLAERRAGTIATPKADRERAIAALPPVLRRYAEREALVTSVSTGAPAPPVPRGAEPQPVGRATALELAVGGTMRLDSVTVRKHYLPLLAELPKGRLRTPETYERMLAWPPAFRAIVPELAQYDTDFEREAALPWLLLAELIERTGVRQGEDVVVHRAHAAEVLKDEPELLALYDELAPDQRPEFNGRRQLMQGLAEEVALDKIRAAVPRLLNALPFGAELPALPALDAVVEAELAMLPPGAPRPLAGVNFLGVQHLLGDTAALMKGLVRLGLQPERANLVGVPYSTHERTADAIRDLGFEADTSWYPGLPYGVWREPQICFAIQAALQRHAENGEPIVVLDDGGYITRALHRWFPSDVDKFVIVEQTTRGVRIAEALTLGCPVVAVGRSDTKRIELPGVAAAIKRRLLERLRPLQELDGGPRPPALLLGYGWMGGIVAEVLAELGHDLVVVDPSPAARQQAERDAARLGVRVVSAESPDAHLENVGLIAGTTGTLSLTEAQRARLGRGQVVFSCSSSDAEFGPDGDSRFHADLVVQDGSTYYLLLGGGYPINFSGRGEVSAPEYMQYTMAGLAHGVLQAVQYARAAPAERKRGVVPLDPARDHAVVELARRQGHLRQS